MKTYFSKYVAKIFTFTIIVATLSVSCKKLLDKEPEVVLSSTNMYRNVFDADAAVIGIYGKLMGLAKQYVVLNELRADLMQVTDNADNFLREINQHNVSSANPYADPKPIYSLINNCNDVLKNFNIMLKENKFTSIEYQQRYSDIGAIRSWLYLQLGIHYGKVPYVTDPLETLEAAKDQSKYPLLEFNVLLDSLINFTEALPVKVPYPAGTSVITTVDGSFTGKFFIEKNAFLGDLHLWKGNYRKAATYYRSVMEAEGYFLTPGSEAAFNNHKVRFAEVVTNNDLAVGYIRGRESDINTLIENNSQGWRSMFSRGQDAIFNWEWLWVLPFNANFAPENPFINLFSNNGGSYLVKPSQNAIDKWNSQTQTNSFPFDARGGFTWKNRNGQPVIMKYLYQYVDGNTLIPINPLLKNGQWFLNRATNVHLKFAEAANRDNETRVAYAMVNLGIQNAYDTSNAAGRDVTNLQNTLFEPAPYNFDARNGEFPRFRGPWHRQNGIRGRARLRANPASDSTNMLAMENSIINEGALELAYEGYRWPDLLRVALRRNDPAFLADAIFAKMQKDGNPQAASIRAKLMDRANWYLPLKW